MRQWNRLIIVFFLLSVGCNSFKKKVDVSVSNHTKKSFDNCSLIIDGIVLTNFPVIGGSVALDNSNVGSFRLSKGLHIVQVKSSNTQKKIGEKKVLLESESHLFLVFTGQLYYQKVNDTCLINLMKQSDVGELL